MASRRAAAIADAQTEDANRSLSNWRAMTIANLRMKCNEYELSEVGTRDELIRELLRHFESLKLRRIR